MWEHFERVKDSKGVTQKGRCLYYAKLFNAHPKRYGTSSLRNHVITYTKLPHDKDIRQSLLTLKPATESSASENIRILGTWKFDKDSIRKALTEMVICDELPFKFVE